MNRLIVLCAGLMLGTAGIAQVPGAQTLGPDVSDGSPPERDARGIPVISAPAVAPPGANQWMPMQNGMRAVPAADRATIFASRPSSETYPNCTATVTDNCIQAYVRRTRMQMSES